MPHFIPSLLDIRAFYPNPLGRVRDGSFESFFVREPVRMFLTIKKKAQGKSANPAPMCEVVILS